MFSPKRRSKAIKFAKNDRFDALIILARDEPFSFSPLKMIQRGDHWTIFLLLFCIKPYNFASFAKLSLAPASALLSRLNKLYFQHAVAARFGPVSCSITE